MIFAYSDETEFSLTKNSQTTVIGSGLFVTSKEITQELIDKALIDLANDSDKTEMDLKTLSNGFFHASSDSKNAHSHLCSIINKHLKGCFRYSYFDKAKMKPWEKSKTSEEINRLTLGLSSLEFYNSNDKVSLVIEERQNFTQKNAESHINKWHSQLDLHAYDHPSYITCYPDIQVSVMNKTNPGLQVVDFLLWVFNRASMNKPDNIWRNRLKFTNSSSHKMPNSPDSGGDFYINESPSFSRRLNYPFSVEDPKTKDEFYLGYLTVEHTLRQLVKINFPDHASHLRSKLDKVNTEIFSQAVLINQEQLSELASLFLRLFDTLPIYNSIQENDKESWSLILKAKKMAGLFLRNDLIHGVRSSMDIVRWRNLNIESNPEIFNCP